MRNQTTEFRLTFSRECKPNPGCDEACPLGSSCRWCHPLLFANCWLVTKSFCCVCVYRLCVCRSFLLSSLDKCKYCLAYSLSPTVSRCTQPGCAFMAINGFSVVWVHGWQEDDRWLEEQTQELTVNNTQWIFYFHPLSCLLLCFLHNYITCYKLCGFTLSENQHLEALQQFGEGAAISQCETAAYIAHLKWHPDSESFFSALPTVITTLSLMWPQYNCANRLQ